MSDDEMLKQMPKLTTTLNAIRKHGPCVAGWKNLLEHLGKTAADDEPLPFRTILESNRLDDALWCLRALPDEMDNAVRLLVCDLVDPAMVYVPAEEIRPQSAIDAARAYAMGEISADDLAAAYAAAHDAAKTAAYAAAKTAAYAAAKTAARDAARDDARAVAKTAAWAVAKTAAWAAAKTDASDAARAAAVDTAWDAARAEQEQIFVAWLDKMENVDE